MSQSSRGYNTRRRGAALEHYWYTDEDEEEEEDGTQLSRSVSLPLSVYICVRSPTAKGTTSGVLVYIYMYS